MRKMIFSISNRRKNDMDGKTDDAAAIILQRISTAIEKTCDKRSMRPGLAANEAAAYLNRIYHIVYMSFLGTPLFPPLLPAERAARSCPRSFSCRPYCLPGCHARSDA